MTEDNSPPETSSNRSTSSTDEQQKKKKTLRHLQSMRILYSDYDGPWQKKFFAWAKEAILALLEKGFESEQAFYQELANCVKESITSSAITAEETSQKWNVVVGNNFAIQADAVKDTISFFAIGDTKFLIYRSK